MHTVCKVLFCKLSMSSKQLIVFPYELTSLRSGLYLNSEALTGQASVI